MEKATTTIDAWLTSIEWEQTEFAEAVKRGDQNRVVESLAFLSRDMTEAGWTKVGTAEITVTLVDDDAIRANLIDALKEQRKSVLAEAQAKAMRIDEKIQNLLAIEGAQS